MNTIEKAGLILILAVISALESGVLNHIENLVLVVGVVGMIMFILGGFAEEG